MSILVFIPTLSRVCLVPFASRVDAFLGAIWKEEKEGLVREGVQYSQLSLRFLVHPAPLKPQDTLRKRVVDGARQRGWASKGAKDDIPSDWRDSENIHVCLYLGPVIEAAEMLPVYECLWGAELAQIVEQMDYGGTRWRYVPKRHLDSLQMPILGYVEDGLLIRSEYDLAIEAFCVDTSITRKCEGVIVTGHPGIGKTAFLYYLLLLKLSERTPVALQLRDRYLLFTDEGVSSHSLTAGLDVIPTDTWALSDSNDQVKEPCSAFLDASTLGHAWVMQTTSPVSTKWKDWKMYHNADMFIMGHFSIQEISVLSEILDVDVDKL